MRAPSFVIAAAVVVVVVVNGGCSVASLLGGAVQCTDDAACPGTAPYCVDFICRTVDEPAGEGEGDAGEGEGDVGEGEGEGEGDAGEGEGEGDVGEGEGEGEGDAGEGEGEGEAPLCPVLEERFDDDAFEGPFNVGPVAPATIAVRDGRLLADLPQQQGGVFGGFALEPARPLRFSMQVVGPLPITTGRQVDIYVETPPGDVLMMLQADGVLVARIEGEGHFDQSEFPLRVLQEDEPVTLVLEIGADVDGGVPVRWLARLGDEELLVREQLVPQAQVDFSGFFSPSFGVQNFADLDADPPPLLLDDVVLEGRCGP